ncbi:MAG TPA: Na+/H+ antiporter subunit E [Bacillota bacterium]|nr:Na+/H+ antiporter subunit E [Bacillota bacterium]
MAFQIIVHLLISVMWMFLSETYTLNSFLIGFLIGALLLTILRRFIPGKLYLLRVYSIIKLIIIFLRELILSNIEIVKLVYQKEPSFEPGVFAYPTELKSNWELTLLANLITLTPGSLSVAISEDNKTIFVHAMHVESVEDEIRSIKDTFEAAIREVTK